MNTPICDFVRRYAQTESLRLHMPGHKGRALLGMEAWDITEIGGADSLYEAGGIIQESEENAGRLFGCSTYYSTEGSSQCIRAMMYLAVMHARMTGRRAKIAAGRNAHKTFLSAAVLLDLDVEWLLPDAPDSYLSCIITPECLDRTLCGMAEKPAAVYLTSPDYLGGMADIKGLSAVCRKYGALLIVDNAHGAYLRFLPESMHPIDLGADLCCDSAHKTLPALTGAAYLHISDSLSDKLKPYAKGALALFGSTSPSYLILQSLDAVNGYLHDGYREKLADFLSEVRRAKEILLNNGYELRGDEPMKLTIAAKQYGYRGTELAERLENAGIVCEFADPDFLVLMPSPETEKAGLERLVSVLLSVERRARITETPPVFRRAEKAASIRDAALSLSETIPVDKSEGRILAAATVGCPPAVPILVCGERIDRYAVGYFRYYGIETCTVTVE